MENILVLLAHNDDEFFIAPFLRGEIRAGNRVVIAYLTHGSAYGTESQVRISESLRVLAKIGVKTEDIHLIGLQANIFDSSLAEHAEEAYRALAVILADVTVDKVLVIAWEGGHMDHDACNSIAMAFSNSRGLQDKIYEFPAYNSHHLPFGLFRVMSFAHHPEKLMIRRVNLRDALWAIGCAFEYPSQRWSFLGLLPGASVRLFLLKRQALGQVPMNRNYTERPHSGRLFYEQRFGVHFERFLEQMRPFLAKYLPQNSKSAIPAAARIK